MDAERFETEKAVLNHYLGSKAFAFGNLGTSSPYLRIAGRTNNGKAFVLRMDLTGFPYNKPSVYVETMLRDHLGRDMNNVSGDNHTLSPMNGWTQICHYHPDAWRSDLTLFLVYLKCMWWLNIHEKSVVSGNPMAYYLRHQQDYDVY